ncbi:MAG TPA: hypothetical protein VJB67_02260 [Patescibacteria group bacterium]|nr:hypothetical protein [Patescibacteria group bacterium]
MKQTSELDKLKEEILGVVNPQKQDKKHIQWGSLAVTMVLVVLTLFSFVQVVQSAAILSKIKSGDIKTSNTGSASESIPSNLQNLPNMVGGC